MIFRSLCSAITLCLVLLIPGALTAQVSDTPGSYDVDSEIAKLGALQNSQGQWYQPRSNISIGLRVLGTGARVQFGNLGSVAFELDVAPLSEGAVNRIYDNGAVRTDLPRLDERDENGVQTSTPGGRYIITTTVPTDIIDADGNVIDSEDVELATGEFLAYTPGLTRNWAYGANSQQTDDGRIAMSTYSATSEGATLKKDEGMAAGLEIQFVRNFTQPSKRTQWGVLAGITLTGINAKTIGSVASTLNTISDYYSLAGADAPPAEYFAPSFIDYLNGDGTVLRTDGFETTTPITAIPDEHTETSTPGGVLVNGNWQIKGAYFMVRLGPTIRTQLTSRLGLNASVGIAGAYAGSTYSVRETFQVPDLADVLVGNQQGLEQNSTDKFLSGYYADLNLEWAANERTGLFGGVTAQQLGDFDQTVGGRTAKIDIGSSVGVRGGISIRF